MKILYISQYYPPVIAAGARRAYSHIKYLKNKKDVEFTVLSELPTYPTGKLAKGFKSKLIDCRFENGTKIIRVWTVPASRKGLFSRILQYLSFPITAFYAATQFNEKPDIIVLSSPPPLGSVAAIILAKLFRCKFVFDIRDVWPEAGYEIGQISKPIKFLSEIWAKFTYTYTDAFICVSKGIASETRKRNKKNKPIYIIPNGVDLEIFRPLNDEKLRKLYREKLGIYDRTAFIFAGAIGLTGNIENIINASKYIDENKSVIILIGEGIQKEKIIELVNIHHLNNVVKIFDSVEPEVLVKIYNACDVGLANLQPGNFWHWAVPTKIFDYWACGLPVISATIGDSKKIVELSMAGISVEPGNPKQLAEIINLLTNNTQLLKELSLNSRPFVEKNYSRKKLAISFYNIVKQYIYPK